MPGQPGPLALLVNFDDPVLARTTAQALHHAGFAPAEISTPDAVALLHQRPALVILRASAAPEFCRRLGSDPATAGVSVLCLSDDAAERIAALEAGAGACLPASVGADELTATALALLRSQRAGADSLRRAEDELRDADRRKDAFLAMLAHELRGPLAPLSNALHLIRLGGGDPEVLEKARELAERQLRQLTRLVDDLLDVSRVAQGKLRLMKERVDVAGVVAQAVETARSQIVARRHELNVLLPAEPLPLEADPARLVQILSNLLSNAARYTPEGGKVWLCAEHDDGDVLFRVRDTGVGLTQELLPRVFELFAQAQPGSQGGLGVGLALVRGLAELHGGSVLAFSEGPGEGSEFIVRLPGLPQGPAAQVSHRPEETVGPPPRRVLVVDDDVDAAESLAMVLRLHGHEARVAHDGITALELARLHRPEVVILDVGLPGGLDGNEVARRLRREPALKGLLLVALTGYGQDEDRRRADESGFDRFLVKPAEAKAVEEALEQSEGGWRREPG